MSKSYYRDVQLLLNIIRNQKKIIEAINHFGCDQSNLDKNDMTFDLCAFLHGTDRRNSKVTYRQYKEVI